jgi:hypothetical protein
VNAFEFAEVAGIQAILLAVLLKNHDITAVGTKHIKPQKEKKHSGIDKAIDREICSAGMDRGHTLPKHAPQGRRE